MRVLSLLAVSLLALATGCRSRLPVDRPPAAPPTASPAPTPVATQVQVEYYQISDG
jgi:hypothetical protein